MNNKTNLIDDNLNPKFSFGWLALKLLGKSMSVPHLKIEPSYQLNIKTYKYIEAALNNMIAYLNLGRKIAVKPIIQQIEVKEIPQPYLFYLPFQ